MKVNYIYVLLIILLMACKKDQVDNIKANPIIPPPDTFNITPELISPKNSELYINAVNLSFQWKQINKAKLYVILISLDSNFNNIIDKQDRYVPNYIFKSPNSEKLHGTYYWKIQAIDSAGTNSEFSKVYKVNCLYNYEVSPEIKENTNDLITPDPFLFPPIIHFKPLFEVKEYEISNDLYKNVIVTDSFILNACYVKWAQENIIKVRAKLFDDTYTNYSEIKINVVNPSLDYEGEYQIEFLNGFNNYKGPAIFKAFGSGSMLLEVNDTLIQYLYIKDFFNCAMKKGQYYHLAYRSFQYINFIDRSDTTFVSGFSESYGGVRWTAYKPR